jgi:hypothetical protein
MISTTVSNTVAEQSTQSLKPTAIGLQLKQHVGDNEFGPDPETDLTKLVKVLRAF